MSLNKEYAELMGNNVKSLVEHSDYNKTTHHVTFDASKLNLPEGITEESMKTHVNFINDTTGQVREAVAQIARTQYADNDKLTTVDGTLAWGGINFNSQHNLKQAVGENESLFGQSTTAVDYVHSADYSQWVSDQDKSNIELATKLFG